MSDSGSRKAQVQDSCGEWEKRTSRGSGKQYWFNRVTGKTQWKSPFDPSAPRPPSSSTPQIPTPSPAPSVSFGETSYDDLTDAGSDAQAPQQLSSLDPQPLGSSAPKTHLPAPKALRTPEASPPISQLPSTSAPQSFQPPSPQSDRPSVPQSDIDREALQLSKIYGNDRPALINLLGAQKGVRLTHAQVVLGLCGLAVVVTSFSGGVVIKAGTLASQLLVIGIGFIFISASISLIFVSRSRYVTEDLNEDLRSYIRAQLQKRKTDRRYLAFASFFWAMGLLAYLAAISFAALTGAQVQPAFQPPKHLKQTLLVRHLTPELAPQKQFYAWFSESEGAKAALYFEIIKKPKPLTSKPEA